ncbi:hypothetical protein Ae201684P_017707 [Aphanomyces euteiches]|nr:hypothetical protein Ae201684P_017707 [Aphanomyces euteiches]KAH9155008.1 hypothetical protein AeRB84_002972 [Aphanomyces euteiches]
MDLSNRCNTKGLNRYRAFLHSKKPTTPPSYRHPNIPNMVGSVMDDAISNYICASDRTAIDDLLALENWMIVTGIPNVADQSLLSAATFIPTEFQLPKRKARFLDAMPDTSSVMIP